MFHGHPFKFPDCRSRAVAADGCCNLLSIQRADEHHLLERRSNKKTLSTI
jgi:hypothetical protein